MDELLRRRKRGTQLKKFMIIITHTSDHRYSIGRSPFILREAICDRILFPAADIIIACAVHLIDGITATSGQRGTGPGNIGLVLGAVKMLTEFIIIYTIREFPEIEDL